MFADVKLPELPLGWHVIVAAAAALGTLILLVRGLTYGGDVNAFGNSISAGLRWGGWLLVLAGIAEAAFAVLALRESGESVSFDRSTPETPPPAET